MKIYEYVELKKRLRELKEEYPKYAKQIDLLEPLLTSIRLRRYAVIEYLAHKFPPDIVKFTRNVILRALSHTDIEWEEEEEIEETLKDDFFVLLIGETVADYISVKLDGTEVYMPAISQIHPVAIFCATKLLKDSEDIYYHEFKECVEKHGVAPESLNIEVVDNKVYLKA